MQTAVTAFIILCKTEGGRDCNTVSLSCWKVRTWRWWRLCRCYRKCMCSQILDVIIGTA